MGGGISSNFDEIQLKFETKFWKVHSALKKDDHTQVSLWLLNLQSINDTIKNRKDREKFKMLFIQSIAQARRIHHPNVLKIYDVSDDINNFGFSSEPIENVLSRDQGLTEDEILYVSDQIVKVIHFLHSQAKLLYLGLSPETVCTTKTMEVKIFNFNFSIQFTDLPVIPEHFDIINQLPISFTSPEYLMNQHLSYSSDVYSIGCFIASLYNGSPFLKQRTMEELIADFSVGSIVYPESMNSDMQDLVSKCLSLDQSRRPKLEEIAKSKAFSQLSLRALRFIDLFMVKSNREKYDFYKGLGSSISVLSPRIQRHKVLPLMISDVLAEPSFATAVVPTIFKIGESMSDEDFVGVIVNPLKHILKLTFPLELGIINLNCMDAILERTRDASFVLPLFVDSMKSKSGLLRNEAVKHVSSVIKIMDEETIVGTLLPILIDFMTNASEAAFLVSVIECFSVCCEHIDNDKLAVLVIPQLTMCWNRIHDAEMASAIAQIAKKLNNSVGIKMKYTVPMLSDILASANVNGETQEQMLEIIEKAVNSVLIDRNLEAKAAIWKPEVEYEPKNIIEPVKPAQIDVNHAKSLYNTTVKQPLTEIRNAEPENAKAKLFFSKPRQASTMPTLNNSVNQISVQQQTTNLQNTPKAPVPTNRTQQNTYNAATASRNRANISPSATYGSIDEHVSAVPNYQNAQGSIKPNSRIRTNPEVAQRSPIAATQPTEQKPPVNNMFSGMKLAAPRRTK